MSYKIVIAYTYNPKDTRHGWSWQILDSKDRVAISSGDTYYSTARQAFNAAEKACSKF